MKNHLFLVFLFAAFFSTAQNCPTGYSVQSDTIGSPSGAATSSEPFNYTIYASSCGGSWTIYDREELAANNIYGDCYINSITLFGKKTSINPQNVKVYMLEVPQRALNSINDTIPVDSMVLVATVNTLSLNTTISGVTLWLDTVFHYTGQGHLLVAFRRGAINSGDNKPSFVHSLTGRSILWERSTSSNISSTITCFQPVIIFNRCESQNALIPPTSVTATETGATSLQVSWIGNASSYDVVVCEENANPDTVNPLSQLFTNVSNNSISFSNLQSNRRYIIYVRSVYGSYHSAWTSTGIVWPNQCGGSNALTVNYLNGNTHGSPFTPFYSYSNVTHAASWSIYNQQELQSLGVHDGSVIQAIAYKGWDDNTGIYIAPQIRIYMKEVSANGFNSVSDSVALGSMTLVHTSNGRVFDNGWTYLTLDSTFTYTGNGNLMIAVARDGANTILSGTLFYFSCDDTRVVYRSPELTLCSFHRPLIALASCSSCAEPTDLSTVFVRDTVAQVTWNPTGSSVQYLVHCQSTDNTHTLTEVADSTSIQLTGLLPNTTYNVTVSSICGAGDTSIGSQPLSFTTDTSVILPYNRIQIGDEYTPDYSYYSPINSFFRHSWVQMIYPAESIGRTGYIDTLWFKAALASESPYDTSATIYMGHTSMSVHTSTTSWLPDSSLTMVLHASSLQPSHTGWFALPLDNPFYYNGEDNLVIAVSNHCTTWTTAWQYYYESHPNTVLTRRSDSDVSCGEHPGQNIGGLLEKLPLLRISINDQSCTTPHNLSVHNISDNNASLAWASTPNDSLYLGVYHGYQDGFSEGTLLVDSGLFACSSTSFDLIGLQRNTHYVVEVRTVCVTGDTSNANILSFQTTENTCPAATMLRVIDCSDVDAVMVAWNGNAPAWQLSYGLNIGSPRDGTHIMAYNTTTTLPSLIAGGNYSIFVRPVCGVGDTGSWTGPLTFRPALLVLNRISHDTIQSCHLHIENMIDSSYSPQFYDTIVCYPASEGDLIMVTGFMNGSYLNTFRVYDGDNTNAIMTASFSGDTIFPPLISTYGPLTLVWNTRVYSMSQTTLQLDVTCIPDNGCHTSPRAMTCHPLDTSVFLHWTVYDSLPPSFSVAYGLYDVFDTSDASTYQVITGITDTNYWLTGLTPGNHYYAAVRSECGNDISSRWTIAKDFYTNCYAIPRSELPYHEDFSSWGSGHLDNAIDSCYHSLQTPSSYSNWITHYNHLDTVDHYITLYNVYSSSEDYSAALVLPLFEDHPSDLTISFMAKKGLYNSFVEVGVLDDPRDIHTFTPLYCDTLEDDSWYHFTKTLDLYDGDSRYIAIVAPKSSSDARYFYIANIEVSMELPCMPPLSISIDSVTTDEVTLHIQDSTTPDSRTFVISQSSDISQIFDSVITTGSSCTFSHLDNGTRYYVWARNTKVIDRVNVQSPWTGPVTFKTVKIPVYYYARGVSGTPSLGTVNVIPQQDSVSSNDYYLEGTVLDFYAEPITPVASFLYWNNGEMNNPLTVTLTQDTVLTAFFEQVGIDITETSTVAIMPNPANDNVSVRSQEPLKTIACYDMNGRQLLLSHPDNMEFSFNVSRWNSGTYIVKTILESGTYIFKLIVKR